MTYAPIKGTDDLARVLGDILTVYLVDGIAKHEMGIGAVKIIPMALAGTHCFGPGVSVRTVDGKEYHVAVIEQWGSGKCVPGTDTARYGE